MDYSALAEQVRGLGAYKAGVVDLQDVRFDRAFRAMCETNACGNYENAGCARRTPGISMR